MFIKSKIQFFESKSQPGILSCSRTLRCLSSQRYNFLKANHNPQRGRSVCKRVVYQVKDTIFWKQITTTSFVSGFLFLLFIKSKIQFFESKSQPLLCLYLWVHSCLSSQRYNFLKANHNSITSGTSSTAVVYQVKDTIFWKQMKWKIKTNEENYRYFDRESIRAAKLRQKLKRY